MSFKWKKIKVFISSTFDDMHAERDYLIKYVFPKLREWCEHYKLHFYEIDLRWGINERLSNNDIIKLCKEKIDDCRPFFIGIIGNRYGDITKIEIDYAVMKSCINENDISYHSFFYFRKNQTIPSVSKVKFLEIADTKRLDYYKEKYFGNDEENNKLSLLKERIFEKYSKEKEKRIYEYKSYFDLRLNNIEDKQLLGRIIPESLEDFGNRVYSDLLNAIKIEYPRNISNIIEETLTFNEQNLHESFSENYLDGYVDRCILKQELYNYINNPSLRSVFVIYGEQGSGKTSLLSKLYSEIVKGTEWIVFTHFIGATQESSSLYYLLRRVYKFLKPYYSNIDAPLLDVNKLVQIIKNCLKKSPSTKLLIIIDALNHLEDKSFYDLDWLPNTLADNIKIIVSTLDEGKSKIFLEHKKFERYRIELLNEDECREIVQKIPSIFLKSLNNEQVNKIVNKIVYIKKRPNPLYLRVILEELRIFGSFFLLDEKIDQLCEAENLTDLFQLILERLENDFNKNLIETIFCLLECSRYGLTEKELTNLLIEIDPNLNHKLIITQIRNYLIKKGSLIGFYHIIFSTAVRKRYIKDQKWHNYLANYFNNISLYSV